VKLFKNLKNEESSLSNNHKKGLKRKYIPNILGRWMLALSLISMSIVTGVVYFNSRSIIYDKTLNGVTEIAEASANELNGFIETQMGIAKTTGTSAMQMPVRDRQELRSLFIAILETQPQLDEIGIGFSDDLGIFAASSLGAEWKATQRSWYQEAMLANKNVIVTEPYKDFDADDGMMTTVTYNIGEVAGFDSSICIDLTITSMTEKLNSLTIGKNGYAFLVTKIGSVVTHENEDFLPKEEGLVNISDVQAYENLQSLTAAGKPVEIKDYDGINKYFVAIPIKSAGWTLYAAIPSSEVMEQLNRTLIIAVGAMIVMAVAMCFIAVVIVRQKIGVSLSRLLSGFNGLSSGDLSFKARHDERNDEISRLYDGFGKISAVVKDLIEDISVMGKEHAAGNYKYKIDETKYTGAYAEIISGVNDMTFTYADDFIAVLNMLEKFADGDFTANVRQYPGELSQGNVIINKVRSNLASISGEIAKLADRAAGGDLTVRADADNAQGEWLKILVGLNKLVDEVAKPINETGLALKKVAEGDLSAKVTGDYSGAFDFMKTSLNDTVEELSYIIITIAETLKSLENKDMTVRIDKVFKGDFNQIKHSVNNIIENQSGLIRHIAESSAQVSAGAKEIEAASVALANGVTVQAQRVENITEAFEKVSKQTFETSENAAKADKISKASISNANDGNEKMQSMLAAMHEIMVSSDNIATIIKTIRDIAFQTNMLALNASVEAARAGAQGKGFNVVADEVRNLAMRSSKASKETQELIHDIVTKIKEGTGLATAASDALVTIVNDVNSASRMVSKISKSSVEQKEIVDAASNDMEQISHVVHSNSATSEQTAAAATELSQQAWDLSDVLRGFKV
jgi:methyl-accepting chemotaxis protein